MKKTILCFSCLLLLIGNPAQAGDALGSVFDEALMQSKFVLLYDQCVQQGFIVDQGPIAEQRLRDYFDGSRTQDEKYKPEGITGDQVADAATNALDMLKSKMTEHPMPLDQVKCDSLEAVWPKFAKQHGF